MFGQTRPWGRLWPLLSSQDTERESAFATSGVPEGWVGEAWDTMLSGFRFCLVFNIDEGTAWNRKATDRGQWKAWMGGWGKGGWGGGGYILQWMDKA